MNDLIGQVMGWLPMLGRPEVLVQLAVVALVVVGWHLMARRFAYAAAAWPLELAATVVLGGLGCWLLAIAQQPMALALLLITFLASLQVSELLLKRGASVYLASAHGRTPLHLALQGYHRDVAQALLDHACAEARRSPRWVR